MEIVPISDEQAQKIHEFYNSLISGLIERNNLKLEEIERFGNLPRLNNHTTRND